MKSEIILNLKNGDVLAEELAVTPGNEQMNKYAAELGNPRGVFIIRPKEFPPGTVLIIRSEDIQNISILEIP